MQKPLTLHKRKSWPVWVFISMSGSTGSGRNSEPRSRPGRYCSIWELMHYVKVLRYIWLRVYQMINALWLLQLQGNVPFTTCIDGSGEDAGHQPFGAVCRGAVWGGESQRAEAGEKEAKAKKSTQKQVRIWYIWTGGRGQGEESWWGNHDLIIWLSFFIYLCCSATYISLCLTPRVLLSLWRAVARSVVATMRRMKLAVMRPSPPIGALPVVAQTTPNKVKQMYTDISPVFLRRVLDK